MVVSEMLDPERLFWKLLPLHPQPQPFESFTSYLLRLAEVNGLKSIYKIALLAGAKNGWSWIHSADFPNPVYTSLAQVAGCMPTQVMMTTFFPIALNFGYSSHPLSLRRFLRGSLAQGLRYCPLCLTEHTPYYRLPWRFLALPGCIKHGCAFLDRCGHCGSVLPHLSRLSRMAWCGTCQNDLRTCHPVPLLSQEKHLAHIRMDDLEFLLSSTRPLGGDAPAKILGMRFARLRQQKNLSITEVARLVDRDEEVILDIEYVNTYRKATLADYLCYADILGCSLREIFDVDRLQAPQFLLSAPLLRIAQMDEEQILRWVEETAHQLKEQGVPVLLGAVSQCMGVPIKQLRQYPRVHTLLNRYHMENSWAQASVNHQREDELLKLVEEAVMQLESRGSPVTQQRVCAIVGVSHRWMLAYPRVRARLMQLSAKRPENVARQRSQQEEALLEPAKRVIQQLVACEEPVTRRNVCKMIGVSMDRLKVFPRIRALLQQYYESHPGYEQQVRLRENELATRVKDAVSTLTSSGEAMTQRRICQIVGLPYIRLERYPRVKALLDQYQTPKDKRKQRGLQSEKELLERVEQAIEQLRKEGEPILPRTVALIAHFPLQKLDDYPRVKARLQQILNNSNQRDLLDNQIKRN